MNVAVRASVTAVQVIALLAVAPLLNGVIKKIKARFQRRVGPPVLQGYRDLAKWMGKESLHAAPTSPLFRFAPTVSLTCAVIAAATFPCVAPAWSWSTGDVITALYILALGRFFTALAGLDAASAFGGLGSSRDVSIAALAEPVAVVAILTVAAGAGTSTDGAAMAAAHRGLLAPWRMLAAAAFFMVVLAECARVPVDNPATHLELTMVHEAMLLEYSGRELAASTLAAQLKQAVLLAMTASVFLPDGSATTGGGSAIVASIVAFLAKLFGLAAVVAIIESSIAKLRLFRVPDFLGAAATLAILAYVAREGL